MEAVPAHAASSFFLLVRSSLPAAIGVGALAQFQLVAIEPTDPLTMIGITIVLTLVALTACLLPARKATKVDPMNALRAD